MKRLLSLIAVGTALILLAIYWLSSTQSGLRWGLGMAPESIQIGSVEGELSDFSFTDLSIAIGTTELTIEAGKLQWHPFKLLRKSLIVDSLTADQVTIKSGKSQAVPSSEFEAWSGLELPIDIRLAHSDVTNIQILQDQQALEIDTLLLSDVSVVANQLQLKQLQVNQAQNVFEIAGRADLSASPTGQVGLDYSLNWMDFEQQLESTGVIEGSWQSLQISQSISQPLDLRVDAQIAGLLSDLIDWEAVIKVAERNTQTILNRTVAFDSGEFRSSGTFAPEAGLEGLQASFKGQLEGGSQQYSFWALDADLNIDKGDLTVERLVVEQKNQQSIDRQTPPLVSRSKSSEAGSVAAITANGMVKNVFAFIGSERNPGTIDLKGSLSAMPWPLTGEPSYFINDGQFNLEGSSSDYSLSATATGLANGQQLDVSVDLAMQSELITINRLNLQSGQTVGKVTGSISNRYDLVWDMQSPDIGNLVPGAHGSLASKGFVSGLKDKPQLQFDAQAQAVSAFGYSFDDLSAEVDASLASLSDRLQVSISANNLRSGDLKLVSNIKLSSTGTGANHRLQLNSKLANAAQLTAMIEGGIVNRQWHGELSTLSLDDPVLETWALADPAPIDVSSGSMSVSSSCLQNQQQSVCFDLDKSPKQLLLNAELNKVQFANADVFTDLYDFKTTGLVNGQVSYVKKADQQSAVIDVGLTSSDVVVDLSALNNAASEQVQPVRETLKIKNMQLVARQKEDLIFDALIEFQNGDRVAAELSVSEPIESPDFDSAELRGHASAKIGQLAALPASLLNDVSLNGQLNADLVIEGSISDPKFSATSEISNASARVRELGLELNGIELNIRSNQQAVMVLDGHLESGEGRLGISGTVDASNVKQPEIQLALQGEKLTLARTSELSAVGSVDLSLDISRELMDLQGSIILDEAELDFKLPESAILASDDVVLLGEEEQDRQVIQKLNLSMDLGQKTHIQAQGLDAYLLGKVRIYQEPGGIVRGEGQVKVNEGRYQAYGQNLKIDKGQLAFSGGSIDDPAVDLKAQKSVGSIVAGVSVTGRAGAPVLNLYSTPGMSDQDILSVLLFDKSVSELGSQDALTLLRIADSLRGDGQGTVTKLTQSIQDTLGLTDLDFQLTDKNPSIQAGKQLSSKVYIGYGYGLLDATQSLIMRYKLNDAWSIKADLGADSGADLRYQVER